MAPSPDVADAGDVRALRAKVEQLQHEVRFWNAGGRPRGAPAQPRLFDELTRTLEALDREPHGDDCTCCHHDEGRPR